MELNAQTVVAGAALLGAAVALYKYFASLVRYIDHQKEQDKAIAELGERLKLREEKCQVEFDKRQIKEKYAVDALRDEMNEELCIINYGLLACLKGMKEQGCNGPVTEAVSKLEKHLNQKAHNAGR